MDGLTPYEREQYEKFLLTEAIQTSRKTQRVSPRETEDWDLPDFDEYDVLMADLPEENRIPKGTLKTERDQELLVQYKKFWLSIYGVDPVLGERAALFRTRELAKQGGTDAIRTKRLAELTSKIMDRKRTHDRVQMAGASIAKMYRHYREKRGPLDLSQILFRIEKNSVVHYPRYDIVALKTLFRHARIPETSWKDPTFDVPLTADQRTLLSRHYYGTKSSPLGSEFSIQVANSGTDRISIPRHLFTQHVHNNSSYLLFRLIHPVSLQRITILALDFHDLGENTIFLPSSLMKQLQASNFQSVICENCSNLQKATYVFFEPKNTTWYNIPNSDTDGIKAVLTTTLEREATISIGQTIKVTWKGVEYTLDIKDIKVGPKNNQRVLTALPKFTEVKIEFKVLN